MDDRGRTELRAYENLAYIGVSIEDPELLQDLLAEANEIDLEFLAGCTLEEFLEFARRSR